MYIFIRYTRHSVHIEIKTEFSCRRFDLTERTGFSSMFKCSLSLVTFLSGGSGVPDVREWQPLRECKWGHQTVPQTARSPKKDEKNAKILLFPRTAT